MTKENLKVYSFSMPKIYQVSMIIEPGIIGGDKDRKFIYIDSSANIGEKIKANVFNYRITEKLNIDPLKTAINFKVNTPKHSRFIKVISEWEENKVELGLKASNQLFIQISNEYKKLVKRIRDDYDKQILEEKNKIKEIETQRKDIDQQILIKKNQIKEIETQRKDIDQQILIELNEIERKKNDIKLNGANLKIIGERQKELLQEIKNVRNNTEKIVQERNNILQHKGNADDISLLLYSTVIQQNVAYFNQLADQINELKNQGKTLEANIEKLDKDIININTEIERAKLRKTEGLQAKINNISTEIVRLKLEKTEGLQTKIDDIKVDIDRLSLQKDLIENIRLIQEPQSSIYPIKPKKKLNTALAFVVGLFISVVLAFFVEYLKKAKSYPAAPTTTTQEKRSVKNQEQ
ncbi:hypothetical protein ES703_70540 [subsurface metagenome]